MLQEFISSYFSPKVYQILIAILESFVMIIIPGIFAIILGGLLGLLLFVLRPDQKFYSKDNISTKYLYKFLDLLVNIGRSIPFIILMIAILPFTRLIVGKTIGTVAACVPLTITAIPFMARVFEHAFLNVSKGVIEAATSMGASTKQILFKVVLPESKVNIINGIGLMLVTLVGYSAMAGIPASGGGLGALAYNHGYQRFDSTIILITVILIILIVQLIQYISDSLAKKYTLTGH